MAWQGKTAVITGVARPAGIGQACANLFYKHGYNIVGLDVSKPIFADDAPWKQGADQATQHSTTAAADAATAPPRCAWLQLDLARQDDIMALSSQLQQLGVMSVQALVNNAGIADPYMQSDDIQQRALLWSKYIAVNLSAPFLLTEALLPMMQSKSSIVHISSTRALQSEPFCEGYGAAKAGLLGLTHAQAASLSSKGIRVNAVLPGWIDTSGEQPSSITKEQHEWHWTGSVGIPSDVAELVLFLADGSKSGFITGQQFVVDGGVTKRMTYPE